MLKRSVSQRTNKIVRHRICFIVCFLVQQRRLLRADKRNDRRSIAYRMLAGSNIPNTVSHDWIPY
jgi:hypothetical protein